MIVYLRQSDSIILFVYLLVPAFHWRYMREALNPMTGDRCKALLISSVEKKEEKKKGH